MPSLTDIVKEKVDKSDLASSTGDLLIGGIAVSDVAEAVRGTMGNFVTPEQFFTGDINDENADWLEACNEALTTGRCVLLSRIYNLSGVLNIPANSVVVGLSRKTTGFKRLSVVTTNSVIVLSGSDIVLSNFIVDAGNLGNAPSVRLNCVSIGGSVKRFNISKVDVYNATGYGHVTFGSESNPQVEGVYNDCYAENCQVLFEQIGALDVSLYDCRGLGVAGRTLSMMHPYAGSKKVTYTNCHFNGVAGAGIEATVTTGQPLGPFTFINCSISITGSNSAIYSSGDNTVDMYFYGGSYKTIGGASAVLQSDGIFKAVGTRFDGAAGFNCPVGQFPEVDIELSGCTITATNNSATGTTFAVITNGANPRINGGSVEAYNGLEGGASAINGSATLSGEAVVVPTHSILFPKFIAGTAGVASFTTDSATQGYVNIALPINATRERLVVDLSLSNSTDEYIQSAGLSWAILDVSTIRVKINGISHSNLKLHYNINVLP